MPKMLTAWGQWSVETPIILNKNAYPGKTVGLLGDDESSSAKPVGQLAMYVSNTVGDLENGKLYGLKVTTAGIAKESDMKEGTVYSTEFVELTERNFAPLNTESDTKGVMAFTRVEDIDYRRGSASKNKELYFCATGGSGLDAKGGTTRGRVYKLTLDPTDPTKPGTLSCILDGDKVGGVASDFHSPDNILVTENYLYIQEDPTGVNTHYARVYQYNIATKEFKIVFEADQTAAITSGRGNTTTWEFTGMIDVSDVIGVPDSFLLTVQHHGWENTSFTDPNADPTPNNKSASTIYLVQGLKR
jgi:hypothetical protein